MNRYFIHANGKQTWKELLRWILTPFQAVVATLIVLSSRKKKGKKKYEISICGLFKNEGRFLKEWLDYHLISGVDHFYMYNNNSDDNYIDILRPYIENGIVDLIDWPQQFPQMPAYKHCYDSFHNETSWLGYIDIDEFVCTNYHPSIKDWIKKYEAYPSVLMYWKVFGTGGKLAHDDNQYVIEQYLSCYNRLMSMGKLFINTKYQFENFTSPHILFATHKFLGLKIPLPPVNEYKKFICFGLNRVPLFSRTITVQLNHYWSKAYDIFIYNKTVRSDVFSSENENIDKYVMLQPSEAKCISTDHTILKSLLKLRLLNK